VAYCWSINEADGLYSDPWLVPEPVENPPAA